MHLSPTYYSLYFIEYKSLLGTEKVYGFARL